MVDGFTDMKYSTIALRGLKLLFDEVVAVGLFSAASKLITCEKVDLVVVSLLEDAVDEDVLELLLPVAELLPEELPLPLPPPAPLELSC